MKKYIIIHYSSSSKEDTKAEDINEWHKKRNWGKWYKPVWATKSELGFYAQYHEIIEKKGINIKCRNDNENAWHSGDSKMNREAYAICIINDGKEKLDNEQVFVLRDRLNEICSTWNILPENVLGHNEVKQTACPGKMIDMNFVRSLIKKEAKEKITPKLLLMLEQQEALTEEFKKEINKLYK